MRTFLQTIGWIACIVYASIPAFWLAIHPWTKYWRSRQYSPYLVLLPYWAAMWIVLGAVTAHWRHILLYSTPWIWIPSTLLFALGLWIYKHSAKHFSGAQLSGSPEIESGRHEQRLVTSGLHGRVRHPVYLAHLCEMLAWSVGTGLAVLYILAAFAVLTGGFMIRMEENELEQRFGGQYREYRQRVPSLFPYLRSRDS